MAVLVTNLVFSAFNKFDFDLIKYAVQLLQRTAVQNPQSIHHTFHLQYVAILCGRVPDSYSQYDYTLTDLHTYLALECLTLGIPHTKLRTKFEVSSSSSFRDIAL